MTYSVKTDAFEGPFDLLLYLVSRKKVDIGAISVNEIADQYLAEVARMKQMDLEVASDFLLVASTLLEIKAHALIPQARDELDEEVAELSPDDAREMLIGRLVTYKQFKGAAGELTRRFDEEGQRHARSFGPGPEFYGLMPDFLEGVSIDELAMLAATAMARRERFLLESEHIAAKPIPVESYVSSIYARIKARAESSPAGERAGSLKFSELLPHDARPELVVVTFLAILELYKRRMVTLEQPRAFGDIEIAYLDAGDEGGGEGASDDEDKGAGDNEVSAGDNEDSADAQ